MKKKTAIYEIKKKVDEEKNHVSCSLAEGEVLTDTRLGQWKIGSAIGTGGFGEIYLASDEITRPVTNDAKYVVKVEPFNSGPLFVEIHFYANVGKKEPVEKWIADRKLKSFGMPHYLGSGSHYYNGERYRFIVLPRYGMDLQTVFLYNGKQFNLKTAFTLAVYIIDVLEYIHHNGYVHADIKASNLVLNENNLKPVYLIDYGLACKFKDDKGNHKKMESDQRKAHTGTLEFTSRDAHLGAHSRRGDLEVLGYNIIKWITGRLPWEGNSVMEEVAEVKNEMMSDVSFFLDECFGIFDIDPPDALVQFFKYINNLKFKAQPDYNKCREFFQNGIKNAGYMYNGELSLSTMSCIHPRKRIGRSSDRENDVKCKKTCYIPEIPPRKPCAPKNFQSRLTRKSTHSPFQFDWPAILSGNPEKPKVPLEIYDVSEDIPYVNFNNGILEDDSWIAYEPDMRGLDNPTPAMTAMLKRKSNTKFDPNFLVNSNFIFNGNNYNIVNTANNVNSSARRLSRNGSRSSSPEVSSQRPIVKCKKIIQKKKPTTSVRSASPEAVQPKSISKCKKIASKRKPSRTDTTVSRIRLRSSIRAVNRPSHKTSSVTVPISKVKPTTTAIKKDKKVSRKIEPAVITHKNQKKVVRKKIELDDEDDDWKPKREPEVTKKKLKKRNLGCGSP